MNGFGVLNEAFLPGGCSPARLAMCLGSTAISAGRIQTESHAGQITVQNVKLRMQRLRFSCCQSAEPRFHAGHIFGKLRNRAVHNDAAVINHHHAAANRLHFGKNVCGE